MSSIFVSLFCVGGCLSIVSQRETAGAANEVQGTSRKPAALSRGHSSFRLDITGVRKIVAHEKTTGVMNEASKFKQIHSNHVVERHSNASKRLESRLSKRKRSKFRSPTKRTGFGEREPPWWRSWRPREHNPIT